MAWSETDERKKRQRVAASDVAMAERHAGFDRSAQDTHMKYERSHFAVVGEGSRASLVAYRRNYARIDWSK